jgi:hypothetical protein
MSLDYGLVVIAITTVLSITNIVILAYNLKLNRDSTQLRKWVDTLQHSNLLVKLEGTTEMQISITNIGEVPIDNVETKVEGTITIGASHPIFTKNYRSKTMILQKETSIIPLYRALETFLLAQKLIATHYEEQPTGERDPYTDEMVFFKEKYTHITKPFEIDFSIKIEYSINKMAKIIPKEFRVYYNYVEEFGDPGCGDPECRYSDNFTTRIEEIQWTS